MAANPLAAFLQGLSEDQPPRTPVDEFMPPGMGLDEDDFYRLIEAMSNNPALNFNVGMVGPPSMPKGPFVNMTDNQFRTGKPWIDDLYDAIERAIGQQPEPRGSTMEIFDKSTHGGDLPMGSGKIFEESTPITKILGDIVNYALDRDAFGGTTAPGTYTLQDIIDEIRRKSAGGVSDIMRRIDPRSPNHPSMRN